MFCKRYLFILIDSMIVYIYFKNIIYLFIYLFQFFLTVAINGDVFLISETTVIALINLLKWNLIDLPDIFQSNFSQFL